jgi:hypothetical protein
MVFSVAYFRRGMRRTIGSRGGSDRQLYSTSGSGGDERPPGDGYNQNPALRGRFDVVWDNRSQLDSTFNGVDLTLNKRFDQRWMLIGASFGNNEGDIFGTADLNNPNFQFRHGVIGNQVPVSIKISTSYQAPRIRAGSVFQHYTGIPDTTTVSVGASTVALTQVTQSIAVEPRGTTRLPNVNLLGLAATAIRKP